MNILIKKIASQNKVDLPDLLTRPVGRSMYKSAKKKISQAFQGETVVCDFEGVEVIDPSFVDEFIIMMLKDSAGETKKYYVRIKNLSKSAEQNIRSVMDSYQGFSDKRYALLTEDLTSDNGYVIGSLSNDEKDVIDLLRINRGAVEQTIIESLDIDRDACRKILNDLLQLGIVKRDDSMYILV